MRLERSGGAVVTGVWTAQPHPDAIKAVVESHLAFLPARRADVWRAFSGAADCGNADAEVFRTGGRLRDELYGRRGPSASAVAAAASLASKGTVSYQVAGTGAVIASLTSVLTNLPFVLRSGNAALTAAAGKPVRTLSMLTFSGWPAIVAAGMADATFFSALGNKVFPDSKVGTRTFPLPRRGRQRSPRGPDLEWRRLRLDSAQSGAGWEFSPDISTQASMPLGKSLGSVATERPGVRATPIFPYASTAAVLVSRLKNT